jgi:ribosomal protein S18 acetylase RimI-like enzyme
VPGRYGQQAVKVRRHPLDTGLGGRVRVRPWAFDRDVVQLALADQGIVPAVQEIQGWVDALATGRADLRAIRTGALFADAAGRFAAAGFTVIDTLTLLRVELAGASRQPRQSTSLLRARRHLDAARVDRAAFGDPWGNDAADLAEIRRATPIHRARARFVNAAGGRPRELVAFAISGAAAGHGYLQRLAVAPDHQGRGHGRVLTLDSLAWMRSRRLAYGLVNTAVDNERALALYESVGFQRLADQLVVMQLDVDGS